jgi:hypothetical protein
MRVPERVEAVVDTTQRRVPPIVCPKCGRGMTPLVVRWRRGDEIAADCTCTLNGCAFVYYPATVRLMGNTVPATH